MERIKINGRNDSRCNCVICGKKLTYSEYRDSQDKCLNCRLTSHNKNTNTYLTPTGENEIDLILTKKREER